MYSSEQRFKLSRLKESKGNDDILNQFKLLIYDWDVGKAIKYYENDEFCVDYCFSRCGKRQNTCKAKHSLLAGRFVLGNQNEKNLGKGKMLSLYAMYKKIHVDKTNIYNFYCTAVRHTENSLESYLKAEKFMLKALSINPNNGALHNNYALLLRNELKNFDKAEKHYKIALQINPNHGIWLYNFGAFLLQDRHKIDQSLIYLEKGCSIQLKNSQAHYWWGLGLFEAKQYSKCIETLMLCLDLNRQDNKLGKKTIRRCKEIIRDAVNGYISTQEQLNVAYPGFRTIEWMYKNRLLSLKGELLQFEVSKETLEYCSEQDIKQLINEMKLTTANRIKFRTAIAKLKLTNEKKTQSLSRAASPRRSPKKSQENRGNNMNTNQLGVIDEQKVCTI